MLTDEDQFLHTVAVLLVPVVLQTGILFHKEFQFIGRHRGIPLTGIAQANLLACLLEHIAHIRFIVEPTDAFGTNDALRPLASHELIEQSQIESGAARVDIGSNTVFLSFAFVVMMVVMMMVVGAPFRLPRVRVIVAVVVMVMLMLVVVVIFMIVIVVVVIILVVVIIVIVMLFYLADPSSRGCDLIKVEHIGKENLVEFNITIVCLNDLCFRLQGSDDLTHAV